MNSACTNLVTALRELADFLRPLNKYWPDELERLAAEAEAAMQQSGREALEQLTVQLEAVLSGRKGLGDLYVSSPLKREQFMEKRKALQECVKGLKPKTAEG